jgi:hypothetical protein
MDSQVIAQARKEYPGTQVPKDREAYKSYWRRLAMWAYKFGPALLVEEDDETDRS